MDIDLEKAKKEFIKYTENYDLNNDRLRGKQLHSLRVMDISEQIAENLGLSQEEIKIATLIGLLHDIARFEQYTKYQTFRDIDSIDHGDFGEEILDREIRKYIETNKFDEIIKKAVRNHNKYKIQDGLTEKEKMFAQIVRDADKIDIFYEAVEFFWKDREYKVEESTISEETVEQFRLLEQIQTKKDRKIENPVNDVIKIIAFIFDLNYKPSFEILRKNDYINKVLNRYNFKDEYTKNSIEEIRKIANKYVENH